MFPRGKERASKAPWGNKKKTPGKNLQEYPKARTTIFGAKRGNSLINNQNFNAPKGKRDFKFKLGNSSLKFLARGGDIPKFEEC